MSVKVYEAREHVKAAEKYLKTSLLRWKPDFDSAAEEYSQAAQCYRIARDVANSKECYLKAHEYFKKTGALFHAGKSMESALMVAKEALTPAEIFELATGASQLYQQHGSGDSGAVILEKGARMVDEQCPEMAAQLLQQAADASSIQSGQHQGMEYIGKASRILVRLGRYEEAADSIRREIGYYLEAGNTGAVGRLTVAMVLVHLARGDIVAAEKVYKEWGNNCESPEVYTLEQLLQAFDEEDPETAKKALSSPFIRSMDVEYARLANTIPLPQGLDLVPKAKIRENATASYISPDEPSTIAEQIDTGEQSRQSHEAYSKKSKESSDDEEQLC